ncbi:ParA family protein [Aestuariibacter halophilus]|uniref:ParA family protein n=1 Tax=Fluctibacter halophilus TaxID=226011 RepID=A0ABS8G606_9ALTE|nr:ParA family protein [Aestuariibacter halophilus]MCC2616032.1 ParA family protein [Aestuariibacter halophilus]
MRIIGCVNQKGGVGKTTVCVNLAAAFRAKGLRVLAIDLDPQAHLSQSLGIFDPPTLSLDSALQGDCTLSEACIEVENGLQLVAAGQHLFRLESVQMKKGRGLRLKSLLQPLSGEFDIVMIDCPPSNGFLVVNGIAASTELLVPVTADYLGLSGLSAMLKQLQRYERVLGRFERKWVVINRYQSRKICRQARTRLQHYLGERLLPLVVQERAVLAECPGHGQSVFGYAPKSQSCDVFRRLAKTMLQVQEEADEQEQARCA